MNCISCNTEFKAESEDLILLKKLSEQDIFNSDLLAPNLCPMCRLQRRMSFRNPRNLYQRKCDVTGKNIISNFSEDSHFKVCDKTVWFSDTFDPMNYGRDYDFNRPFFEQFAQFTKEIPLPSLRNERSENCEFNNDISDSKNCYLCSRTNLCSDLMYCYRANESTDSVDCMQAIKSDLLYECIESVNCHNSKYLYFCDGVSDSAFLYDCRNCDSCFMSSNLRNKKYVFLNEQLTKEKYEKKLAEFNFGSYLMCKKAFELFKKIRQDAIKRHITAVNSEDCIGDNIFDSKNCFMCFGMKFSQDCRYMWDGMKYKDSMDCYSGGRVNELIYECTAIKACYNVKFSVNITQSSNIYYSYFVKNSSDVFGSIGLGNKKFYILNKQYSEEKYKALMIKIIEHMKGTGEWGQFFPMSMSPFPYNDSVASEFFPLSEDEAKNKGCQWQKKNPKEYQKQTYELKDDIKDVKEDIAEQILSCIDCEKNYKIIPQELAFYKRQNLSIPRHCPDCRHLKRVAFKNPVKLRKDTCKKCNANILTSFRENDNKNLYCSDCYSEALN